MAAMNHTEGSAANDQDRAFDDLKEPSLDFIDRVLEIVRTIPPRQVMTYGDIAAKLVDHDDLAGTIPAYGARLVGQVMARAGADVAWWRVVRSTGQPPKFHEARAWPLYLEEGTPVIGTPEKYRIDLKRARLDDHQPRELRLF